MTLYFTKTKLKSVNDEKAKLSNLLVFHLQVDSQSAIELPDCQIMEITFSFGTLKFANIYGSHVEDLRITTTATYPPLPQPHQLHTNNEVTQVDGAVYKYYEMCPLEPSGMSVSEQQ